MTSKFKGKPKKLKKSEKTPSFLFKPRRVKIRVIGIGGGGSSIVSEIARSVKKASFVIVDSDHRIIKKGGGNIKVFQLGENLTGGLGTGMDIDLGEKIARKEKDKIARILKDQDIIILVASLGGGFASGATPIFAEISKDFKNISLGIFTLPFHFEGEKKMKVAEEAIRKMKENLSGRFVVSNEKIFQIIDKKTPLKKALSGLNRSLILILEDLIEMISRPGLINIDFADLRTILKGKGRLVHFGSAFCQGPNQAEEVVKKVFQNPLSVGNLGKCKKILFNIKGGKDLTLKEVEKISSGICDLNRAAKIIFGISQDPKYNGKIKLSLIEVGEEKQEKKKLKPKPEEKEKPTFTETTAGKRKIQEKKKKLSSVKDRKSKQKQIKVVFKKEKKKKIRRSGLEIRKAKKEEEEQEWAKEPEWEIPTFLRKKR